MGLEPVGLLIPDLIGVFVFALSGALAAVRARLDVFGVLVLAAVTALGGGIMRDVLIGTSPPNALRHWPYVAVAAAAGLLVFWLHPQLYRIRRLVLLLDAAGLGLFTLTGTKAALRAGLGPVGASIVGLISGIGGGVLRDVLLREIPLVLRREIYAVAALAGAIATCLFNAAHALDTAAQIGCVVLVFGLRVTAIRRHWSAPVAREASGVPPGAGPDPT